MAKAPRTGKVKTRLVPALTAKEAAALSTCFLRDTAKAISELNQNGVSRGVAVYAPADARGDFQGIVPEGFLLIPQRGEKLEERLLCATEELFRHGFTAVCLINSDSPTVPPRVFVEAATILAQAEETVVLGPCEDGGYYLIGVNKLQPTLFQDIAWSSERVLQQTILRVNQAGLKHHLLPTWYDVDDGAGLWRLCNEFFGSGGVSPGSAAPATRQYLEELLEREGRKRIWPA